MTVNVQKFSSLSALLRAGLGDALSPKGDTFLDLMTDDISFEFPFPLPDGIRELRGKEALAAYLPKVGELFTIETLVLERTIMSADKKNAILEFTSQAYANRSNLRYDQTYVSVVDIREGLVSRYKDYWNPLIVLSATGGADAANSVLQNNARNA